MQRGFSDLAKVPLASVDKLAEIVTSGIEPGDEAAALACAKVLGAPADEVDNLVAALGLLVGFVARRDDARSILHSAVTQQIVNADDLAALLSIAEKLQANKPLYEEALDVSTLAKKVAPSFRELDISVELRFAFEGDQPTRSVPIVLCNLLTDSRDHRAIFQLSKRDLSVLIDRLSEAQRQVEVLESRRFLA